MSALPLADDKMLQVIQDRSKRIQEEKLAQLEQVDADAVEWAVVEPERDEPHPVLDSMAFYGLVGKAVEAIDPTTEADKVAVLATILIFFGNAVDKGPHTMVGDSRHGANLNVVIVGDTAKARKGTSLDAPLKVMRYADPAWADGRIVGGLTTGEGLIRQIRDPSQRLTKAGDLETVDAGVDDKRLQGVEPELSRVLKSSERQASTLTETIRIAWDSPPKIQTATKTNPSVASNPHVSILAHITEDELKRNLTETDMSNGFANRFLWLCVRRSKLLPNPRPLSEIEVATIGSLFASAIAFSKNAGEIRRSPECEQLWESIYPALSAAGHGLGGALTARSEAITIRLSLIYALLDQSNEIRTEHLIAALALWEFAAASVKRLFGDMTGDTVADRIFDILKLHGRSTRNEVSEALGKHTPAARIETAIQLLHRSGRIEVMRGMPPGGRGRPITAYQLATRAAKGVS